MKNDETGPTQPCHGGFLRIPMKSPVYSGMNSPIIPI
jgi:hypothetical protein